MIRDLLVPLLRQPSDDAAIDTAVALAGAHSAHVAALVTVASPMPLATEWGYVPAELNQQAYEFARQEGQALAARVRQKLAGADVACEVRVADSVLLWPEDTLALHACHSDICVIGGPDAGQPGSRFALSFKSLLLRSGRPVLVVPADCAPRPFRRITLAWAPTPEASRALHEALPLMAKAEVVSVVLIDPEVGEGAHGQQPGADIARHLARHGLDVRVVSQPRQGRSVGEAVLQFVQEDGSDLLVMGGYGHSRWREAILGGTTRSVLEGMRTPVLFAH